MNVENPAALRFIMQDDIYLLNNDEIPVATVKPLPATPVAGINVETVIETPVISFNYLGSNKKKLLIITHYTDNEFIAEAHLAALENILKRKGYQTDDVAIFNLAVHADADFMQVQTYFTPQKLLILGQKALPANLEGMTLNQLKHMQDCTALYSFSFAQMMDNTEQKKAFWEQMKNL